MDTVDGKPDASERRRLQSPTEWLGWLWFRRTLTERGPSLNIARLMTSRHLNDLQWIATFALIALLVMAGLTLKLAFEQHMGDNAALLVAAIGAALAAFNWCYQTGNRRLGTIDLFGCEISTLCRVMLVTDFAATTVKHAETASPEPPTPKRFTSQEAYTQVYDKQIGELIPFDVTVVKSVAEFYNYYKTMMDYLRARAAATTAEAWRDLTDQVIYMQFLMCESGRYAVEALIEFNPDRAESKVNILCSELVLYGHLARVFPRDFRGQRLEMRRADYDRIIGELKMKLFPQGDAELHPAWERARKTWEELDRRYQEMCAITARVWSGTLAEHDNGASAADPASTAGGIPPPGPPPTS